MSAERWLLLAYFLFVYLREPDRVTHILFPVLFVNLKFLLTAGDQLDQFVTFFLVTKEGLRLLQPFLRCIFLQLIMVMFFLLIFIAAEADPGFSGENCLLRVYLYLVHLPLQPRHRLFHLLNFRQFMGQHEYLIFYLAEFCF